MSNALNLGFLSSFIYQNEDEVKANLEAIQGKEQRQFTIDTKTVQNPFLLPSDETYFRSKNLKFVDTAKGPIVTALKGTNTQLAMFDDDTQVYIAVRGTEGFSWPNGIRDWVSNVQATAVKFEGGHGKVHDGFHAAFISVKGDIDDFLSKNGRTNKKIVVTGHSLGGAVATIIAAYIRGKHKSDVMLYTFGSPRAGDADFVNHYSQVDKVHAWRLFNVCDVVPMVPTEHTDIVLPLIITGMNATNPIAFIKFPPNFAVSPFKHFGVPIALKKTKQGGVMLIDPKDPPPFEFYSNKAIDDYKVKWTKLAGLSLGATPSVSNPIFLAFNPSVKELFKTLGDAIIGAHEMPTYVDIIGSVLRQWAKVYVSDDNLSHDPGNAKHLDERIKGLEEMQNQLMVESLTEEGRQQPDATTAPGARMTNDDKAKSAQAALNALLSQKGEMETLLLRLKEPKAIASLIAGEQFNAHVHREIEFQAQLK